MAYLDENATWEQGIYQWETQDPVVGGPDGIDNVPTRQLANRTGYLKTQVEAHAAATDPHPQYTTESEVHTLVEVTQPQFDSTKKPASTEFVQRALGNQAGVSIYSATATLPAADWGKLVITTASTAITLTMPTLSTAAAGASILLSNEGSANVSLAIPSGSTSVFIGSSMNYSPYILPPGMRTRVVWDGANIVCYDNRWGMTTSQYDSSALLATTTFVQRALGNYQSVAVYATGVTLPATDWGKVVLVSGAAAGTITMPPITGIPTGAAITIWNYGAYNISLASPADSTSLRFVYGTSTTVTPYVLYPGSHATIVYNGPNLWVFDNLYSVTPAQFDNTHRTATTEFVQRAIGSYNGITGISSATTLTATQAGQPIMCYSGATIVLPVISTSGIISGTMYHLCAASTTGVSTSGESILYGSGGTINSFTLYAGEDAILVTNGVSWYLVGGSAASRMGPRFAALKSTPGYQILPSGIIFQWGYVNITTANTNLAFTFPITFPNACFVVVGGSASINSLCGAAYATASTGYAFGNNVGAVAEWYAIGC